MGPVVTADSLTADATNDSSAADADANASVTCTNRVAVQGDAGTVMVDCTLGTQTFDIEVMGVLAATVTVATVTTTNITDTSSRAVRP